MSDIATDILEGNIGKKQEKKKTPSVDLATEILEGLTPFQAKIGGETGVHFLQMEEEPTGKVSTITTKPEMKPVDVDVKRAGFGTLTQAAIVDDPETKLNILSKGMGIPRERFGIVKGRPVYQGDDGILYYVTPAKENLKRILAEQVAHAPATIMGTFGATGGPWTAALGAAGGEGLRKALAALVYKEPQTALRNIKDMSIEAALAYGGEKVVGRGTIRAMDVTKGRQGARLIKAAGRGRERISLTETKQIEALGKKHGITLLPPQTTRSPELISRFNILADLPETADRIGGVKRAQAEQVQKAITKMLDSIAPPTTTAETAGMAGVKAAKTGIQAAKTVRANKAAPLYKKAFESDTRVNIKPIIDIISDELQTAKGEIRSQLLKAKDLLMKPDITGKAKPQVSKLVDASGKPLTKVIIPEWDTTLKGLHAAKMQLDDIIAGARQTGLGNTVKRNYTKIREALLAQMDTASPDYAKARKIFSGESEVFEQLAGKKRMIGRLAKLEGDDVEKAAGLLFRSSPEIVKKARPVIVKYGGEDAWNALLRTHLQKSFESIKETVTGGVTNLGGRFRQKVFGDISQRNILETAMTKAQFKNLEDFATVLDRTGLILGRESTTATRLIQLEKFGGMGAQIAKGVAYPLHTWKMTVYNKVMNILGGRYSENLADAMLSPKAAKQLESMLQLKPGSQKLLQQLGTFVTLVGGGHLLRESEKKRIPNVFPEAIAKTPEEFLREKLLTQ